MKSQDKIVSYLKQKWWYLFLLTLSTRYVSYYKYDIYQLRELNAMNLIFILWLILLLLPLFSEMEFLGIKLKKEMEKAKVQIQENLNDLRMQVMDIKISNSNANANTIHFGNSFLPTEQKLKELLEGVTTNFGNTNDNSDEENAAAKINITTDTKVQSNIDFKVPEESVYLFKVRLMLEKTLADLCEKTGYIGNKSMFKMMEHLTRCKVINNKTIDLINQIIKIANRGIHGEIISKEYIEFIKRVLPEVQKQLMEANTQLNYCVCPKCKYSGSSKFENVCPKCGFTSDD